HYLPRRLPAEVILDAISQVTGVPEKFAGYPPNIRAMQLPDTKVDSYFMSIFGRPQRLQTSVSERQQDPTLPQALHVINGTTLNGKLAAAAGTIEKLAKAPMTDEAVVDELYLAAYSRRPTADERARGAAELTRGRGAAAKQGERRRALEDLAWAVITS